MLETLVGNKARNVTVVATWIYALGCSTVLAAADTKPDSGSESTSHADADSLLNPAPDASAPRDESRNGLGIEAAATTDAATTDAATTAPDGSIPGQRPAALKASRTIGYFGYYASALNGVGTGNYISETAGFANTTFIRGSTTEEVLQKLSDARTHNMHAIVMVQNVFFPWLASSLHADYDARFRDFHASIKDYDDLIAAYYIFDEPYLVNSLYDKIPNEKLNENLTSAITSVKSHAPNKPAAIFFSHVESSEAMLIPSNLDWLGFDCYAADAINCSDARVNDLFQLYLRKKHPHQRLIIALDAYWNTLPTPQNEVTVIERVRYWQKLIQSTDQIVGIFPFLYQNRPEENLFGAITMPKVLGWLQVYYSGLTGAVVCSGNDLVRLNAEGAILGRWESAPMCVPRCVGRDSVRFNVLGAEIDRWVAGCPSP